MNRRFIVFTDHKPLENLNLKSRTDEELGDMVYYLSQYNFEIKYRPGKYNQEADCLSRNPVLEPNENNEDQLRVVNLIALQDILKDQEENTNLQREKLIYKDNIYYKKYKGREKIILSEDFSIKWMKKIHEELCHIGMHQMGKMIKTFYTARNLDKNIQELCKNCEVCIKNKSRGKKNYGFMSHFGPATKPFQIVSIDTVGGFGGSRSTKKYMHILGDHFTRYAYILTSKTQNGSDFVKLLKNITEKEEVGMILSDQYPGINSNEFKNFLKEKSIQLIFTAINAPFSNGLNERLNQTLVNKITCKRNESKQKLLGQLWLRIV